MSKGIQKPTFHELLEDLNSIKEIPERINEIDIIRLKELIIQIDKMLNDRFIMINKLVIGNQDNDSPRMKDPEHWKNNYSQHGYNYNELLGLQKFIQNGINELQQPLKTDNSNSSKIDPPKWLPIGVGFATGAIQEMIKKDVSFSQIAIKFTGSRSNANYVSSTKHQSKDIRDLYSDFKKIEIIYNHCNNNEIKMSNEFIHIYNKTLK